jgi:membrane protein required for colicin V production
MNWLDLAILLTIAWLAIAGAFSGLFRQAVALLATVVGVVLAGHFHDDLAADIVAMTRSDRLANVIAFLAIFFSLVLAGQLLTYVLRGVADSLDFGPFDGIVGLVLGLSLALVVLETVLFLFIRYPYEWSTDAIDGSLLSPFLLRGFPFLLALLPGDFSRAVDLFPAPYAP